MAINKEDLQVGRDFYMLAGTLNLFNSNPSREQIIITIENIFITNISNNTVVISMKGQQHNLTKEGALKSFFYNMEDAEVSRVKAEREKNRNHKQEAIDLLKEIKEEISLEHFALTEKIDKFLTSLE